MQLHWGDERRLLEGWIINKLDYQQVGLSTGWIINRRLDYQQEVGLSSGGWIINKRLDYHQEVGLSTGGWIIIRRLDYQQEVGLSSGGWIINRRLEYAKAALRNMEYVSSDNGLDMSAQVSNACRGDYFHLFRIAKMRKCLNTAACKTLVHSLVTSRIDYGNAVLYGISDRLLHRLDMVQRSAARVVLRIRHGDWQSMTAALKQLHWLPVKWRVEYKLLVLVFRALHDQTPAYLASLITPYVPSRALRSAGQALLTVPRHNLERYSRHSFSCAGPTLCNALPEDIRMTVNINAFKAQLKTHYFKVAFN